MNWLTNVVRPKIRNILRRETPENLWIKCPDSGQLVFYKDVEANQFVIPGSNYHMRMGAVARLKSIFDNETWFDVALPEVTADPLKFRDERRYSDRIKDARARTGLNDAIKVGYGKLEGAAAVVAVQDFDFMGGSLGMAAGEAIVRGLELAVEKKSPFIVFAASGGARMQEGILSLMQMPRTTVGVQMLREAKLPYIVVLTNPTTGGVTASYAMLGDVQIAEPGALIGFAGARVIEQTIREKLPDGFQRAEYLKDHGMVDMVVHRHDLRPTLARLCRLLDQITRDRTCVQACDAGRHSGPDRIRCGDGAGSAPGVNASAAKPPPLGELVARLSALHPARIDLDLQRMNRLLERLDHPERKLPPMIHVAGTNGKGSTVAYLRAILEAATLRVHVYTSPYLVRINECYRLGRIGGGVLVDDDELRSALEHCERVNAGEPITIFEIETAAAFYLFAQHPADVVLLEVGLGGRLDATNVIDKPLASVFAPVSMDHTEFLGDTLMAIAREKAGIIKRDVPVICAEQVPEATAVIEQCAKRLHAPLYTAGQEWHVSVERGRLVYQDDCGLMDLAAPKLFGRHQFDNAGLAIATLRALDAFRIEPSAFEAGIVNAEWPARMQRLASGALVDQGPRGCEIWLDGGHNAEGGRVVAAALGDLEERVSRPLVVIVGMMANKDAGAFLANFAGLTRHIMAVRIPGRDNAMPPDRLADAARALGMRVESAASVEAALRSLARLAYEVPPRILITGSLYLAGHVLSANGTPPG